jgi:hypothetical protein
LSYPGAFSCLYFCFHIKQKQKANSYENKNEIDGIAQDLGGHLSFDHPVPRGFW